MVGCNRLKSPNSGSSEIHEPIYGDAHGSRWMDVSHLTGTNQKGEEKRGFRNRHQEGIIFYKKCRFWSLRKNFIESTTHVWTEKKKNGRHPLARIFFFTTSSALRTAIVLQLVSSTCQGFPVFTVHLHLQKGATWILKPSQEKAIARQFSISKPLFKSFAR